jgi:hypothetical protein
VAKYASVNDRANDVNRIIQNVNTSSTLNREIASGIVWCERIWLYCDVINNGVNQMSNEINPNGIPSQYLLIPIIASPGLHQMFSFQ